MPSRQVIPLPGEAGDLGEAMLALSPMRRLFVYHKVMYGLNNAAAAKAVGYAHPKELGYRTALREDVQLAIREQQNRLNASDGPVLYAALRAIALDKKAKTADRIKALSDLLDRGGYRPIAHTQIDVHHHSSVEEIDRQIAALLAEMNMPVPAELTQNADGVYEVAPTEPQEAPEAENPPRAAKQRPSAREPATPTLW